MFPLQKNPGAEPDQVNKTFEELENERNKFIIRRRLQTRI